MPHPKSTESPLWEEDLESRFSKRNSWRSSGWDSVLSRLGPWFQFLVGELRSRKPHPAAKQTKPTKQKNPNHTQKSQKNKTHTPKNTNNNNNKKQILHDSDAPKDWSSGRQQWLPNEGAYHYHGENLKKKYSYWTSPVVQWLRICLPMQGGHGFNLLSRKISHASGQLSPYAPTTEACEP